MFRKFKFEESLYQSWQEIPLSTQFKLDRVGVRLSLKSWGRFSLEEKNVLCHLSVRSQGELECYKEYLAYLSKKSKDKMEWVDPQAMAKERVQWESLARVPEGVYLRALRLKILMTAADWIRMDDLERYALFKLSLEKEPLELFAKAIQEFLDINLPPAVLPAEAS